MGTEVCAILPGIVHRVGHHCFSVRLDGYRELDGLGVDLAGRRGLFAQFPVVAAVEVLDYADVRRVFLWLRTRISKDSSIQCWLFSTW